jgi:RHS repeat-associated protein
MFHNTTGLCTKRQRFHNEDVPGTSKPQAYLNWMLLDNQFNLVPNTVSANQNGAQQVGAAGLNGSALQAPLAETITAAKSGYLYIYLSNTTPGWDVFFDNLSIAHYSSPLIEENHYYPFGLLMSGISDKAIKSNYAENKYRYNGGNELQNKEFSDGTGLEEYDANFRMYDPQLGRFWQLDPLADITEDYSPYSFAEDNPIVMDDPLGLLSDSTHPQVLPTATVVGHKANCQTCSSPTVEAGPPPDKGSAVASGPSPSPGSTTPNVTVSELGSGQPNVQVQSNNVVQGSGFDIPKAVAHANAHANDCSSHKCALYVREALQAGGIDTRDRPSTLTDAQDYGPYLIKKGFGVVSSTNYKPIAGDVVVFKGFAGHESGHIEMYNGHQWVSDFKQNYFTPGPSYRSPPDPYVIYRYKQ